MSERVILGADDDDDILLLVTTRLRRDGHDVVQAGRGDAALAQTKVLLLTSALRRGYDSGADANVKKPYSPSELSQRVHALLDE